MLAMFTLPGRWLMRLGGRTSARQADGRLSLVLSVVVYLAIAILVLLATHRHRAAPAEMVAPPVITTSEPTIASVTTPPPLVGPGGFVPLQSQAVKDAIHRALTTGTTQRWQDGTLSGYAVPSLTTGANGCRAIRYTIDQQAGAYGSITACDASGH
jgi:hypothetical protein